MGMDSFNTQLCTLLVFCSCIFLVLFSSKRTTKSKPKRLPPGPFPLPILGSLPSLAIQGKPHKIFTQLARVYGPIMTLKLGSLTTIIVSSPAIAKLLRQKHDLALSTPFVSDTVRAHQHDQVSIGWLPASSDKWKTLRKIFKSQLFSSQRLDVIQTIQHQALSKLVYDIRECAKCGVPLDIGQVMRDTSFNFMLTSIFSIDSSHSSSKEIVKLVRCMTAEIGVPNLCDYFPLFRSMDPQGIKHRLTKLCSKLFKVFDGLIEARLNLREERTSPNDLLEILLEDEHEGTLNRVDVRHFLLDLCGAGIDTTSTALGWAMAELIRNPSILRKAQEEIDEPIGKGKEIKEIDLFKLPYLQAIVKETLRLHPVVPLMLPRLVEEEIEVCGFTIPKDSQVVVNAWAIGRDSGVWTNAESFQPERFLGSEVDLKGQHFELIPFGAGRRMCPGLPLASQTMHLVLASLIRSFNWMPEEGVLGKDFDMDGEYKITLKMAKPLRAIPINRINT